MISAAVWLAPLLHEPIHALAYGVLAAGVVQLAFQLPALARVQLLVRPTWGWHHPGTRKVMALLIKVLTPAFSSRQDTRTPVRVAVGCMVLNMGSCVLFALGLRAWGYDAPHIGLSAATALSTILQATLLAVFLRDTVSWRVGSATWLGLARLIVGLVVMGLFILSVTPDSAWWNASSMVQRGAALGGIILASVATYVTTLACMGLRPSDLRSVGDH